MRFLRTLLKGAFYFSVLFFTWVLCLYLRSDVAPPRAAPTAEEWQKAKAQGTWITKDESGLQHIVLSGTPFERGLAWGALTKELLHRQEQALVALYSELMRSSFQRKVFETGLIALFEGLQHTYEPWMADEMWGVAQSASPDFNYFASPYARQLAYHGIHEVGQLFVDLAPLEGACTFVGYPLHGKWQVGRTFDFEGGRIFDEEKILKWVFPSEGHKYLSVIWAGMVGAVSGVNEHGIYVSINAAGSRDIDLRGLPSTLLVTKVLQEARNLDEALRVFRDNSAMVTDIYMVLDSRAGRLFKVEKSALRIDMTEVKEAVAVTNHLQADTFKDDDFNRIRRDEYTSGHRLERARTLLKNLQKTAPASAGKVLSELLGILRDKGIDDKNQPLHLGNRRAIDALIAAHGVLFDSAAQVFYVSTGPSMTGAFRGYDLAKSFAAKKPVLATSLPADPAVTRAQYDELKTKLNQLRGIFAQLDQNKCAEAQSELGKLTLQHVEYEYAAVRAAACLAHEEQARAHAVRGLELAPPHKSLEEFFQEWAH